ncbi:response regulator transcription factor [Streptomyces sp. NPDC055078]
MTTPRPLSPREVQVVGLVAQGQSNQQIGDTLGLKPATVKSHLRRISRVLNARDRAHAVAICLRTGILTTDQDAGR